jgi:NADH:ubiquinone oxidoreductase subunit H
LVYLLIIFIWINLFLNRARLDALLETGFVP